MNATQNRYSSKSTEAWLFFALTFGLSWGLWIPAALWGKSEPAPITLLLHYLGGLMPAGVAIALTHLNSDRETQRDYWRRIVEFKRISTKWYVVILLIVPTLTGLGTLVDVVLGGQGAQLENRFARQLLAIATLALYTVFFGPLPEEIAWRGYALDRLQTKWNVLTSSLILGSAWTVWHLPLFFIDGTYQHSLVGSSSIWAFALDKIPQSALMTWIYNHNQRSTLSAILLHYVVNLVGELLNLTPRAELLYTLLWIVVAVCISIIWKSGNTLHTTHQAKD